MAFSRFSILHSNSLPNFRKIFGHVNSFAIRTSTKHTSAATSQETVKLSFDRYDPPEPHVKNEHITLLTIHGLFGSKQNWRSLSKMFAQRLNARVYALDLRNHGESPHSKAHSYEVMAEDVAAFIREHRLKKIVVLGHSMGGKVAMTMALRQEQQLDRLVVVDSAPVNSRISQEFKRYIDVMKKIEQVGVVKQSQADEIMKNYISEITIRQFLLTNLKKDSTTGQYKFRIPLDVLDDSLGTMSEFPFDSAHHTFHKKTLFISGLRSDYVTPKVHPTIKTFFPDSIIVELDTGHWGNEGRMLLFHMHATDGFIIGFFVVHSEKPLEFATIVTDFLKSKS